MPEEAPAKASPDPVPQAEAPTDAVTTAASEAAPATAAEAMPNAEAASEAAASAATAAEGPPTAESASGTEGASEPSAPASSSVKPRRKKKRRRPAEPVEEQNPLRPDGRERPAFVLSFPHDPELERLVKAFEVGNYAFVREHAPKLAQQAQEPRVRAAAEELARRIEPDPLIKVLLALSIALLVVLSVWAYKTHGS